LVKFFTFLLTEKFGLLPFSPRFTEMGKKNSNGRAPRTEGGDFSKAGARQAYITYVDQRFIDEVRGYVDSWNRKVRESSGDALADLDYDTHADAYIDECIAKTFDEFKAKNGIKGKLSAEDLSMCRSYIRKRIDEWFTSRASARHSLPVTAKLDYREDVDKLNAEVNAKIAQYRKRADGVLKQNAILANQARQLLQAQKKVFEPLGVKIGEPNPFVKIFGKHLGSIDEFAQLAREGEINSAMTSGFSAPEGGWELALLRANSDISRHKGTGTMGEISQLLLNKGPQMVTGEEEWVRSEMSPPAMEDIGEYPTKTKVSVRRVRI
jgi:hypothetical protein